jgi:hypothetical protein
VRFISTGQGEGIVKRNFSVSAQVFEKKYLALCVSIAAVKACREMKRNFALGRRGTRGVENLC